MWCIYLQRRGPLPVFSYVLLLSLWSACLGVTPPANNSAQVEIRWQTVDLIQEKATKDEDTNMFEYRQ